MTRYSWLVLLAVGTLSWSWAAARADEKKEEDKGTVVDFDGLKSRTPATWKQEKPLGAMRFMQFSLPKAKGDKYDAELVIFKGLGGSAKDNVNRWKGQFNAPEGKRLDDLAKVTEMKVAGSDASYLDIQGIMLYNPNPRDPAAKIEKRPDYRMLAIHFEHPKNNYHIKLYGPAKTIEEYKKGFDEWVKSFK